MQQMEWVKQFMVALSGCPEQSAHNVFYAANRMSYRRFLAAWERLFPGDSVRARRLWVTARERTPRAQVVKLRAKRESVKARRHRYYVARRAKQEVALRVALDDAAKMALAMRARSLAHGVDPDREGVFQVIHKGRRLTRCAGQCREYIVEPKRRSHAYSDR